MKILHFADIHARMVDLPEIEKSLNNIIAGAKQEKPDVIVVAGDIFDSEEIKLDSPAAKMIFQVFSKLANIAPVAVVIGTPSHDGTAAEVLSYIKGKHNIMVSERAEQLYLYDISSRGSILSRDLLEGNDPMPDAVISMVPTLTKQYFQSDSDIQTSDQELAKAVSAIFLGFAATASNLACPHIMGGHWQVSGAFISETQCLVGRDIEISLDQISLAQADVVCLGHIHMQQKLGQNVFYSGSTTRLNHGETQEKGYYVHEIDSYLPYELTESRFVIIPTTKRITIREDLTLENNVQISNSDGELTLCFTDDQLKDVEGGIVKVELKVYQDETQKIDRKGIRAKLKEAGAVEVETTMLRVPRINVRSQKILKLNLLPEKLIERASLTGEEVQDTILKKAALLEEKKPDDIIKGIGASFEDARTETEKVMEEVNAA